MSWIAEAHADWHTVHGRDAVCPLDCGAGEDYDESKVCANCDGPLNTGYDYCETCRRITGWDYV
jgi:hypothetical protein